jgi:hypothetical protein
VKSKRWNLKLLRIFWELLITFDATEVIAGSKRRVGQESLLDPTPLVLVLVSVFFTHMFSTQVKVRTGGEIDMPFHNYIPFYFVKLC